MSLFDPDLTPLNNTAVTKFWTALTTPLYDPRHNDLNPDFVSAISLLATTLLALFAVIQVVNLVFNNSYGPYRIKYAFGSPFKLRSVGIYQLVKLNSVVLQLFLLVFLSEFTYVSLTDLSTLAPLLRIVLVGLILLPFHAIEPTRSTVSSASLQIFWLAEVFGNLVVLIQDTLSTHKVFAPKEVPAAAAIVHAIEVVLLINSVVILLFQTILYRPTRELVDYWNLNEWKIGAVRLLFTELGLVWLEGLIKKVHKTQELDPEDIPPIHVNLLTDVNYQNFLKEWNSAYSKAEKKRASRLQKVAKPTEKDKELPKISLFVILMKLHWPLILTAMLLDLLEMTLNLAQTFLLQKFILFFTNASVSANSTQKQPIIVGVSIASAIFIAAVARFTFFNQYYVRFFHTKNKILGTLNAMIYNKAMKLSGEARKTKTSGELVNNMAVDLFTVMDSPQGFVEVVLMPIRFVLSLFALRKIIGEATWSGILAACVLIPLSSLVSTSISKYQKQSMGFKDERTRLTSEILTSIKSIKLFSWEQPMLKRLFDIRNGKELVLLRKIGILNSFGMFFWLCIPFIVSCVCLISFIYLVGAPLTPAIAFPALSLFEVLTEPISMIPELFSSLIETNISLKRLRELFCLEELEVTGIERTFEPIKRDDISISVENADFLWNAVNELKSNDIENDAEAPSNIALKGINFTARKGHLTCIVGRVGNGKTTLIKSLLGELPIATNPETKVKVNGTVSYCCQNPWLANTSVKENILFGRKYDKVFYDLTVSSCQLLSDFEVLPDGDRTVVGEKGISLSGGQKARIALARSVYSRSDIVFLDDVLSAVDAHVGKNIINQVLGPEGILASKTIVLATNAVNVLHKADSIVLIKKGQITERGTFDEVTTREGDLAELIREFGKQDHEPESATESESASFDENAVVKYPTETDQLQELAALEGDENALERIETRTRAASFVSFGHNYEEEEDNDIVKRTGNTEEKGSRGQVKWSVYLEYFKACNYIWIIVYILCYITNVAMGIGANYALKYWSELNLEAGYNTSPVYFLSIYAALGLGAGLCSLIGSFVIWGYCVVRGAQYFHDNMAKSVLRSPMSFFETTPVGRILNRFSDDINTIDRHLIWSFLGLCDFAIHAIGLLTVIIASLPAMFFVVVILFFVYNEIRKYFIPTSRELKRLTSARKSPVFSHLQESVNGVDTIRAYGQSERFVYKNQSNIDDLIVTYYTNTCSNRWLSMRLQAISAVISFTSSLLILTTLGTPRELSAGLVGFIMINAMSVTGTLNAIIRYWADVESKTVSVERLVEYCNLPSEAEPIVEDYRPPAHWPADGAIAFKNYSTKYRENLDPVLLNISIDIKSREKIGIVGRTGAGKSTLSLALFRILEASAGNIEIDGYNTSKLGLYDLRHNLNIIPQDSHAVEGSIRQNLDPFEQYSDEQLWRVLELAHLKEHIQQMKTKKGEKKDDEDETIVTDDSTDLYDTGLSAQVFEGGSNLSSGQRQLLSLARSLLNTSTVLILDEATAAVDAQTDKIIQETIRSEFSDKTILTIAHRLDTILDNDRILVLERGQVKEFDTPANLLADETSIFYSLCKEGGYLKDSTVTQQ